MGFYFITLSNLELLFQYEERVVDNYAPDLVEAEESTTYSSTIWILSLSLRKITY